MIKVEDVKKLAELSRLEIPANEMEQLTKEIGGILGYIDQIQKAGSEKINAEKNPVRGEIPWDFSASGMRCVSLRIGVSIKIPMRTEKS